MTSFVLFWAVMLPSNKDTQINVFVIWMLVGHIFRPILIFPFVEHKGCYISLERSLSALFGFINNDWSFRLILEIHIKFQRKMIILNSSPTVPNGYSPPVMFRIVFCLCWVLPYGKRNQMAWKLSSCWKLCFWSLCPPLLKTYWHPVICQFSDKDLSTKSMADRSL